MTSSYISTQAVTNPSQQAHMNSTSGTLGLPIAGSKETHHSTQSVFSGVQSASHFLVARIVLLLGLAVWMTIAVINNSTDSGTNAVYLQQMISMDLIKHGGDAGHGLLWRAIEWPWVGAAMLHLVVLIQFSVAALMWRAAILHVLAFKSGEVNSYRLTRAATFALSAFIGLWLFFMTGGFWFVYWLHMGSFQQAHMTLLMIGLLSLGYIAMTESRLQ